MRTPARNSEIPSSTTVNEGSDSALESGPESKTMASASAATAATMRTDQRRTNAWSAASSARALYCAASLAVADWMTWLEIDSRISTPKSAMRIA